MITVGFTGTSRGTTRAQDREISQILKDIGPYAIEAHHGDCTGADQDFHEMCRTNALRTRAPCDIVGHPPKNPSMRAFCAFDRIKTPAEYMVRNQAIVDAVWNSPDGIMIAAPKEDPYREVVRSGTWSTVRRARLKLPTRGLVIVWANGIVTWERP